MRTSFLLGTMFLLVSVIVNGTRNASPSHSPEPGEAQDQQDEQKNAVTPRDFYLNLARGVRDAEGIGMLELNPGRYCTLVNNRQVMCQVPANAHADLFFNYKDRFLKEAHIKFAPPLRIEVLGKRQFEALLDGADYDFMGRVVRPRARLFMPGGVPVIGNLLAKPEINRLYAGFVDFLVLSRHASTLFEGSPLIVWKRLQPCDPHGIPLKGGPKIIRAVEFFNRDHKPGLLLTMRDDFVLRFSASNFARIADPSTVRLDLIHYEPDTGLVEGELASLDCRLKAGRFMCGDVSLDVADGSRLHFSQVDFGLRDGQGRMECRDGVLEGTLRRGSQLWLSPRDKSPTYLALDDGSGIRIQDFELWAFGGRTKKLSVGAGTSLKVKVWDGHLSLGEGTLDIDDSQVELDIDQGEWSEGVAPKVRGTIAALDAKIRAGDFRLNSETKVRVDEGAVKGSGIALDSNNRALLRGSLTEFNVAIHENSTFGVPGGLQLVTKAGANLSSRGELIFDGEHPYPLGVFNLVVPFESFQSAKNTQFRLKDGKIRLPLENHADGTVTSPLIAAEGPARQVDRASLGSIKDALLVAKSENGEFRVKIDVKNMALLPLTHGKPQELHASMSGKIESCKMTIHTEEKGIPNGFDYDNKGGNNDNARQYSITAYVLDPDIPNASRSFSDVPIVFQATKIDCSVVMSFTFLLRFETGSGYYENAEDPTKGNHKAPFADWQDFWSDTFLGDRIHVMIAPRDHTVDSVLNLAVMTSGFSGNVSAIRFRDGFNMYKSYAIADFDIGLGIPKELSILLERIIHRNLLEEAIERIVRDRISQFKFSVK